MTGSHPASRLSIWQAAFVIARRDFTAILFSKAFLLFLLGPLLFIGISVAAGSLGAKAAQSLTPPRLALALPADEAARFVEASESLEAAISIPDIETVDPGSDPAELLTDRSRNFAAVVGGTLADPVLSGTQERIDSWGGRVALLIGSAQGSAPGELPTLTTMPTQSSSAEVRSANTQTSTGALTLLFLLTMLLAGMVLSNLVEEKANKIIEILAAAIPMDAVFLGKLFAMLAISFVGIAVWGSVIAIILTLGAGALPELPAPAVGWPIFIILFVIYFAMAYCLVGSIFLAVGSMAPTVRDVQTISLPATMLQLGVFFLATFAMSSPGSAIEIFAIIFPLSSPYTMLARAGMDGALWPHALAIAWQAVAVGLFVKAGATLFKRKVMKSGPAGANAGKTRGFRRFLPGA